MQSITFEEALIHWIAYGFTLNVYIREPKKIPPEARTLILGVIDKLDILTQSSMITEKDWSAISEYQKDPNPKLYRAVWGSFAKEIIEEVSKKLGKEVLLQANSGFESWTANIDIALKEFTNVESKHNLIFKTECHIGEQALVIGGYAHEILFPRKKCWVIINIEELEWSGRTISLLTVRGYR